MIVYVGNVTVQGAGGALMASPIGFYSDKETANARANEHVQKLKAIVEGGKVIMPSPTGPKKVCDVGELLEMLGVIGFGTSVFHGEVKGTVEVHSPRLIVPTSH